MIRILVVCRANVCRSPLAQILLENALVGHGIEATVSSAGTRAHPGGTICYLVSGTVGGVPNGPARVLDHRSRALDGGLVAAADLILTAESSHRGLASAAAPRSQSRIFTLAEAAALTALVVGVPAGRHAAPEVRFAAWVRSLDDARGLLPMRSGPDRRFAVARRPESVWDIPDGHQESRWSHRRALARVATSVTAISDSIATSL